MIISDTDRIDFIESSCWHDVYGPTWIIEGAAGRSLRQVVDAAIREKWVYKAKAHEGVSEYER
jgi:hypothetical protein